MNCKPGDNALLWRWSYPLSCGAELIGRVVKVVEEGEILGLGPEGWRAIGTAWTYEGPRMCCSNCRLPFAALLDRDLIPLPRPHDETWHDAAEHLRVAKPVPATVREAVREHTADDLRLLMSEGERQVQGIYNRMLAMRRRTP